MEILSRDRVPGTNDVTGIWQKLRGSCAEAPRKLRDGFGSTWPLPYRTTNSQLTASLEPSLTSPTPPLNTLPSDRFGFNLNF